MATGKSLTPDENARVIAAVRELLRQHDDNQSTLAPKLGIKQGTISGLLAGRHGAGYALARNVAELRGVHVDELLGTAPRTVYEPGMQPGLRGDAIGRHRDWETARRECEERYGRLVRGDTLDRLARAAASLVPERINGEWVYAMYQALEIGIALEEKTRRGEADMQKTGERATPSGNTTRPKRRKTQG